MFRVSSVPPDAVRPPKGKGWSSWRFAAVTLLVVGGIGVFSGLYDYSDDRFTETPFSQIPTDGPVLIDCHGANQVGGPGAAEGAFDQTCRKGLASREANQPGYMGFGLAATAAGIALLLHDRRRNLVAAPVGGAPPPSLETEGPPASSG